MADRLYRSPTDRVIAGVAGGMAAWLDIDPSLVRIAWALLALASFGAVIVVYVVMMIVVPLPPDGWAPAARRPWGQASSGPIPGWGTGQAGDASAPGGGPAAGPAPGGYPGAYASQPPAGTQPPAGSVPPPGWGSGAPTGPAPTWSSPDRGRGGVVAGLILIALGAWFLVDQYIHIDWSIAWPIVIIALGGALIAGSLVRRRR